MPKKRLYFLMSVAALGCGFLVYVLFRQETYIAKLFYRDAVLTEIQNILNSGQNVLVKYYLPDFLWAFSLCCALRCIYPPMKWSGLLCFALTFFAGVLWEILQYCSVVLGTGDIMDMIAYFLAGLLATIILKERKR